ncbi:hypothetical protein Scep_004459 [Stephania cephalantha]|uniref:Uncharacterized protein n=1 Tax=Stephania cephalantha TaxID=152367 RepID=A0AAP0PWP0_9MAGN
MNKVTPVKDYWSETVEELEASPTEADIIIAQNEEEKAYMDVETLSERMKEPQKEIKEDQPLVPKELLSLNEGMPVSLPKAVDALFVADI